MNFQPPRISPVVLRLILLQLMIGLGLLFQSLFFSFSVIRQYLELSFTGVSTHYYFWQFFSAPLVHSDGLQLFFNLLTLYMFGIDLEQRWSSKGFFRYFLFCALASSLTFFLLAWAIPSMRSDTFSGSTGAILGLLIAYAVYWPERQVYFFFLFPMRMKVVVLITGLLALWYAVSSASYSLGATAHLGGLVAAGILLFATGGEPTRIGRVFDAWSAKFKTRQTKKSEPLQGATHLELEARIDVILDKISRGGMSSLSAAEKKFLRDASDRMNKTRH